MYFELYCFHSMRNMGKNLWICWMACSRLCFLTHVIKASSLHAMLLVSVLYTWAGVLMVCKDFVLIDTLSLWSKSWTWSYYLFPPKFILAWTFGIGLLGHATVSVVDPCITRRRKNRLHVGPFKFSLRLEVDISQPTYFLRIGLDKAN